MGDPETRRLIVHSVALGLAVGGVNLVLARGLAAPAARRLVVAVPEAVPPLVLGVGALMVPPLLGAAADSLHAGRTASPLAGGLRRLADALDPSCAPGVLLAGRWR
jgi:iron(III) transport system permease protein